MNEGMATSRDGEKDHSLWETEMKEQFYSQKVNKLISWEQIIIQMLFDN